MTANNMEYIERNERSNSSTVSIRMHIHTPLETLDYRNAHTEDVKIALECKKKERISGDCMCVGVSMCYGMDGVLKDS